MLKTGLLVASLGLFAGSASATPLDARLQTLTGQQGDAYVQARTELLSSEESVQLRQRVANAQWTASSWRADLAAASALMWQQSRAEAESAYSIRGLSASHYLKTRRPEPSASRDLRRKAHLAPVLAELYLNNLDVYPYSSAATFPAKYQDRIAQFQSQERVALKEGILLALGRSDFAGAPFVLERVLMSGTEDVRLRRVAAHALGELGSEKAWTVLRDGLRQITSAPQLRAAMMRAAGQHRTPAAAEFIIASVNTNDAADRMSAIHAAATLGSKSVWRRTQDTAGLQNQISDALVDLLLTGQERHPALRQAIAQVGHPSAQTRLQQASQSELPGGTQALVLDAQARLALTLSR